MEKLINAIKTKHVSYEVLAAAVLHLSEAEQVKVNNLIIKSLGLPVRATADSIKHERQIKVDDVDAYDVILDVFRMLVKVTEQLDTALIGPMYGATEARELHADAQMLIESIEHANR